MGFLKAETRGSNHTSGDLNRMRKQGKIPAVIYSGDMESQNLFIDKLQFKKMYHEQGNLLEIEVEGQKWMANTKEIQWSPLSDLLHVSFHKLKRGQKAIVEVPLHLVNPGKSPGARAGGAISLSHETVKIWAKPADVPSHIDIDVAHMEMGDSMHYGQVTLPPGCEWEQHVHLEDSLVHCSFPQKAEEETTVEATEETTAETATEAPAAEATADTEKNAA